jgi:hypothetical protein
MGLAVVKDTVAVLIIAVFVNVSSDLITIVMFKVFNSLPFGL